MKPCYRIGATSYIIPADLVPNVEHLAGRVDDVELILFEVEDGRGNLPDDEQLCRLRALSAEHDLSYTVHLPLDIRLGAVDAPDHPSMVKAIAVIERTRSLEPHAYVLHLEGRDLLDGRVERRRWHERAVAALEILGDRAGAMESLAVENLEGYPLGFLDPVLDEAPVSRCVDIGHLWVDGHDPAPFLERHLARTRVIHLHGIGTRDHQSLAHAPAEEIGKVHSLLERHDYRGVLTLEVFNEDDLESSLAALAGAMPALPGEG